MPTLRLADMPGLLGLPPDASPRQMYRESMAPRAKLLEPLLSVIEAEGGHLGALGEAHLAAARHRATQYDAVAAAVTARVPGATVLKGTRIAAEYPAHICRGCIDLDLFLDTPPAVWQAAEIVAGLVPDAEVNVSLRRRDGDYDLFVGFAWPSPLSAVEAPYRVELSTMPLLGEGERVPARRHLPDDARVAQLVLIAEEQLQRPIIGRDVVDVAMIVAGLPDVETDALAAELARWRLAPELAALFAAAAGHGLGPIKLFRALERSLQPWIAEERARRATPVAEPAVEYGLPLTGDTTGAVTFHEHPFGTVLTCPVGTYLLVTTPEVDEEVYEMACAVVAAPAAGGGDGT